MSVTIYTPLRTDSSIRLLILKPGKSEDAINCELIQVDLNTHPEYEALSYTWGGKIDLEDIQVNETTLQIRHNLFLFLRRLRCTSRPRTFWVDALSINQTDFDEKARQVARMGNIFKQATCVRAWLGEHENNSEALFRETPGSSRHPGSVTPRQAGYSYWLRLRCFASTHLVFKTLTGGIPLISFDFIISVFRGEKDWDQKLVGLIGAILLILSPILVWPLIRRTTPREISYSMPEWRSFVLRHYWKRTWIVQEIVFAKTLVIHCGSDSTSWEKLVGDRIGRVPSSLERIGFRNELASNFRTRLSRLPIFFKPDLPSLDDMPVSFLNSLRQCELRSILPGMRRKARSRFSYAALAYAMKYTQCTDQRDRIYALIPIHDEILRGLDPSERALLTQNSSVVPDYTISVPELYVNLATLLCRVQSDGEAKLICRDLLAGLRVLTKDQLDEISDLLKIPKADQLDNFVRDAVRALRSKNSQSPSDYV